MKKMNKLIILLILLCVGQINSQTKLIGIVKNNSTNLPIENANITSNNQLFATSTNSDGNFELIIDNKVKNTEIIVSCIGYDSQTIVIDESKYFPLIVNLNEKSILLEEVYVVSVKNILDKALEKYNQNYLLNPQYEIYFKQVSTFDGKIKRYAEGSGYLLNKVNEDIKIKPIKINKAIDNNYQLNFLSENLITLKMAFLQLNVKNMLMILSKNESLFEIETKYTMYNNLKVHKLIFTQNITTDKKNVITLLIEDKNFAVINLDISGDRGNGIDKINKLNDEYSRIPYSSNGFINFRQYNDKWIIDDLEIGLDVEYNKSDNAKIQNNNILKLYTTKLIDETIKSSNNFDLTKDLFGQKNNLENINNKEIENRIPKTEEEIQFMNRNILKK